MSSSLNDQIYILRVRYCYHGYEPENAVQCTVYTIKSAGQNLVNSKYIISYVIVIVSIEIIKSAVHSTNAINSSFFNFSFEAINWCIRFYIKNKVPS